MRKKYLNNNNKMNNFKVLKKLFFQNKSMKKKILQLFSLKVIASISCIISEGSKFLFKDYKV